MSKLNRKNARAYWLYVITDGTAFCKIGLSCKVERRLADLQVGNPKRLTIYKSWHCSSLQRARVLEFYILERTSRHFALGEWRRCAPAPLERYISGVVNAFDRLVFPSPANMHDLQILNTHAALVRRGCYSVSA